MIKMEKLNEITRRMDKCRLDQFLFPLFIVILLVIAIVFFSKLRFETIPQSA